MQKLRYMLNAASEFAESIWPFREELKIEDMMLFGSVARREKNPSDLDILLIHRNHLFDSFKFHIADKAIPDSEKYSLLLEMLNGTGEKLKKALEETKAERLIAENALNANYINSRFFNDETYRRMWRDQSCKENPRFDFEIFQNGMLWNPETGRFGIKASTKYTIPN